MAFSGTREEYATAHAFLRELAASAGATRTLVIPGNHDIYRPETDNAKQRMWRSTPRSKDNTPDRDSALVQLLEGAESGIGLLQPLSAYNEFAAVYGCAISAERPWWEVRLPRQQRAPSLHFDGSSAPRPQKERFADAELRHRMLHFALRGTLAG